MRESRLLLLVGASRELETQVSLRIGQGVHSLSLRPKRALRSLGTARDITTKGVD